MTTAGAGGLPGNGEARGRWDKGIRWIDGVPFDSDEDEVAEERRSQRMADAVLERVSATSAPLG
jgi:hypothetical protein